MFGSKNASTPENELMQQYKELKERGDVQQLTTVLWQIINSEGLRSRAHCDELHELLKDEHPEQAAHLWLMFGRNSIRAGASDDYQVAITHLLELTAHTPKAFSCADQLYQLKSLSISLQVAREQHTETSPTGGIIFCCTPSLLTPAHIALFDTLIIGEQVEDLHVVIDETIFPLSAGQQALLGGLQNRYSCTFLPANLTIEERKSQLEKLKAQHQFNEVWFHALQWSPIWALINALWPEPKRAFLSGFESINNYSDTLVAPRSTAQIALNKTITFPAHGALQVTEKRAEVKQDCLGILTHPESLLDLSSQAFLAELFELFPHTPFLIPETMWPLIPENHYYSDYTRFGVQIVSDETFLSKVSHVACIGGIPSPHLIPLLNHHMIPSVWLVDSHSFRASANLQWLPEDCLTAISENVSAHSDVLIEKLRTQSNTCQFEVHTSPEFLTLSDLEQQSHLEERSETKEAAPSEAISHEGLHEESNSFPQLGEVSSDELQKAHDQEEEVSLITQAINALQHDKVHKALSLLKEAQITTPTEKNLHYTLALCHITLDDLHSAHKALEKECSLFPDEADALELKTEIEEKIAAFSAEFVSSGAESEKI